MTTFAQHRAAFESFIDCVQGGAGKDAITVASPRTWC